MICPFKDIDLVAIYYVYGKVSYPYKYNKYKASYWVDLERAPHRSEVCAATWNQLHKYYAYIVNFPFPVSERTKLQWLTHRILSFTAVILIYVRATTKVSEHISRPCGALPDSPQLHVLKWRHFREDKRDKIANCLSETAVQGEKNPRRRRDGDSASYAYIID